MSETAEARSSPAHGAAVFEVATAFLTADDPVALIRSRGVKVDDRFASTGSYQIEAGQFAARGSILTVPKGPDAPPPSLTLVMPGETTMKLDDVTARLGKVDRLPALPGKAWQYAIPVAGGRIVVVLTADPKAPASRVERLTVIRKS